MRILFSEHTVLNLFAAIRRTAARVWFGRVLAEPAEAVRRVGICEICPYFHRESRQCESCTCFVDLKTRLSAESCPREFWSAEPTESLREHLRGLKNAVFFRLVQIQSYLNRIQF